VKPLHEVTRCFIVGVVGDMANGEAHWVHGKL
jgi:hypothetical protein